MSLRDPSEKVLIGRFVERKNRKRNDIAVFSLSYAKICNAIRSYEKGKASKKKKGKDLAVLAKTPRMNRDLTKHLTKQPEINKKAWKAYSFDYTHCTTIIQVCKNNGSLKSRKFI